MAELDPPSAQRHALSAWSAPSKNLCLPVLLVAGFAVRLWGVPHMHGWDEDVYLQNAELICCGKPNYSEIDSRPPLLSLIYAGVFMLWHSDYAAWIVTALINALGPVFLYLGGREFVGRVSAAIAALLLGFLPFFVDADRTLLSDGPALTMIVLSFWLLVRALKKQTNFHFAFAGFAMALAVLMRFGSLSSIGILSLLLISAERRVRAMTACAIGFSAGMIPYLVWSRAKYGGYLTTIRNGWSNFGGPEESFLYYLRYFPLVLSWVAIAGLLFCATQTMYDLVKLRGAGKSRSGYLWLWAFAVLCFFSLLKHKEVRYVMPVTAPLLLLAGTGLSILLKVKQRTIRLAGATLLTCAFLFVFWPIHHRFDASFLDHQVSEEMVVAEFLNQNVPTATILYTNQNYPDFAYYTHLKVEPLPHDGPDLYSELNQLPHDGILIAYRMDDDGTRIGPDFAWLDTDPHYRKLKEFPKLILYTYRLTVNPR